MNARGPVLALIAALGTGAASAPAPAAADETQGQAIFEQGVGLVPIISGRPLPAMVGRMTCAGCHGIDGLGGREGGAARAPAISWRALTRPGDNRPAYDTAALAAAIRTGASAGGRALQMPQFDISDAQMEALVAHLQWLDLREVAGLGPDRITLRLPADPAERRAAAAAMAAFNAEGGSFGRRAVAGEEAFVDLGPLLAPLRARLTGTEEQLARDRLTGQPGWRLEPRTDPQAALILRNGARRAQVLPAPASLAWARASGADLEAARIHALTLLILDEFRRAGRNLTRTDFHDRAARIDLRPALAIQDDTVAP